MTGRLKAVLEYDGTDFYGWQIQKDRRTVQGVLEEVFSKRFNRPTAVTGSGRTDKGVHAAGQVAHFDYPVNTHAEMSAPPVYKIHDSLNAMLPPDITILKLEEVPNDFHARFSAVRRRYRYDIRLVPSALTRRYCWEVKTELNSARMRKALTYILGTHDFKPLAKLNPDDPEHTGYRCTIYDASLEKKGCSIAIQISANRFVRGMVRAIAGTLVDVGRGAKEQDIINRILKTSDRTLVGGLAPACGLFLEHVEY